MHPIGELWFFNFTTVSPVQEFEQMNLGDQLFDDGSSWMNQHTQRKTSTKGRKGKRTTQPQRKTHTPQSVSQTTSSAATTADTLMAAGLMDAKPVFELSAQRNVNDEFIPSRGARVLVRNMYPGRVAYAGPVHYAKGDFFGVILDEPHGKNNGKIREMQYFSCLPKHGLMVQATDLKPLA